MNRKIKKIGKGWQYTVYDIGDNRVRKVFNTKMQSYLIMFTSCFPYIKNPIWKFPKYYRSVKNKAQNSIQFIRQSNFDMSLCAHPLFINELNYEQDKVISLKDFFQNNSLENGKKIIDKFIQFNKKLLSYNVSEESFNCRNFGIDARGNIVLMDIGELVIDEENIKKQLKEHPWHYSYVIKTIPKKLRIYFLEEMDKHF